MKKILIIFVWAGRIALEAAEVVCRARRSLDQSLDRSPWNRPPWHGGGGGNYWQGRG